MCNKKNKKVTRHTETLKSMQSTFLKMSISSNDQNTLDELQAILHSKPLTTWTPSIASEALEISSPLVYGRLFLLQEVYWFSEASEAQGLLRINNLKNKHYKPL